MCPDEEGRERLLLDDSLMCLINCSGGCKDCAPDEHAAGAWMSERYPFGPIFRVTVPVKDQVIDLMFDAFCAGYHAGEKKT